jgi:pimeloyl-ACP methyl ester carboxylesterase
MDRLPWLPIIYLRGYAGSTAGIDSQVDDPFYGFNLGATHVRVGGNGNPAFYQFEGPMLRLMTDENYRLLVHGDQQAYLEDAEQGSLPWPSIWVYRFYDQAATTFAPAAADREPSFIDKLRLRMHRLVTADGFDIEVAALRLYDLIQLVREKTGAPKVYLVAHSMGGLIARCMMQKIAGQEGHAAAKDIVAKFFTYGTPHGGISFEYGPLNWIESTFGPVGADIFAPEKMYGYLTPGASFGQTPPRAVTWDPQTVDESVLSPSDIFCLIGTDPKDYGLSRDVVGPKSDGLVLIEHAYVRKAHRAYVYKSHSGSYGEVNSEEGYQNLRRFLFGRWEVTVAFDGLPAYPRNMDDLPEDQQWPVWQADLRLAVRGLPVLLSEQSASQWCPIQINDELARHVDAPDTPVPLVATFLLDPGHERELVAERGQAVSAPAHGGLMRYALSLRVYKLVEHGTTFRFADHLEQVADWSDALLVDLGANDAGTGMAAWAAWNSAIPGANDEQVRVAPTPLKLTHADGALVATVPLPDIAKTLPVLGDRARLSLRVLDRES